MVPKGKRQTLKVGRKSGSNIPCIIHILEDNTWKRLHFRIYTVIFVYCRLWTILLTLFRVYEIKNSLVLHLALPLDSAVDSLIPCTRKVSAGGPSLLQIVTKLWRLYTVVMPRLYGCGGSCGKSLPCSNWKELSRFFTRLKFKICSRRFRAYRACREFRPHFDLIGAECDFSWRKANGEEDLPVHCYSYTAMIW